MTVRKIKLDASWSDDAFTDYATETVELFLTLDKYTVKNFGKRCRSFEPGCIVCEMWKRRDGMKALICNEC